MATTDSWLGRVDPSRVVPSVVRRRFVRKFAVAVLAAMVVAGGIGGVLYVDATRTLDQRVESRVVSTAELQADGIDSWVDGFSRQTRTLSSIQEFQNGQPAVLRDYLLLESGKLTSSFVAVHYVQAADGTIEASTASGADGSRLAAAGQPWANDSAAIDAETDRPDTVYVHDQPYTSPATGDTVLAFISSPPQNTEHVVVVEANLTAQVVQFRQSMAGGETTILDRSGTAVAGAPFPDADSVPAGASQGRTSGFTTTGSTVVGYATVEQLDWTIATQVPTASAYGIRNQMRSTLLLTLVSALLVLGGVTLAVGHRSGTALETLSRRADAMKRGELDVPLETDRADEIGQLFHAFDDMRGSLRAQIADAEAAQERAETAKRRAETAREEADAAREEAQALNEQLEARAQEYAEVMAACAEGDLTRRMATDADTEAMVHIATAYNDVMDEWEATIGEVRAFSEAVQSASGDVSSAISTVRTHSDDVRTTTAEMADGAEYQSDELETVWAELEALSATVEEISAAADTVRERADEAVDRGRAGRDAASDAADALDGISASTDAAVDSVEELEALMSDIERVTDLITDIADQTTILALNANIEAAHADTDSDGFTVVADEVKALAEQTGEATADIEASIGRMREQVDRTVAEIHTTQDRVDTGTETVERALTAFDGIVDDIEAATDGMREIDNSTGEQAASAQEVVEMVETVGDISDRTATEAANVADATTEQVRAVGDVEANVGQLSERATELARLLETFDTADDATDLGDTDVFDPDVVADDGSGPADAAADDQSQQTELVGDGGQESREQS